MTYRIALSFDQRIPCHYSTGGKCGCHSLFKRVSCAAPRAFDEVVAKGVTARRDSGMALRISSAFAVSTTPPNVPPFVSCA